MLNAISRLDERFCGLPRSPAVMESDAPLSALLVMQLLKIQLTVVMKSFCILGTQCCEDVRRASLQGGLV